MEYGVICNSESALEAACIEHGLQVDDVFVICSQRDMNFALRETEGAPFTLVLGHDWVETGLKQADFASYIGGEDE